MPYSSRAQQGYFHAAEARGEMPKKVVDEFDAASKGQKGLPYHKKGMGGKVHEDCDHYSHGGDSLRHHPECGQDPEEDPGAGGPMPCPYCDDDDHEASHKHVRMAMKMAHGGKLDQDDEPDENYSDRETYAEDDREEEAGEGHRNDKERHAPKDEGRNKFWEGGEARRAGVAYAEGGKAKNRSFLAHRARKMRR